MPTCLYMESFKICQEDIGQNLFKLNDSNWFFWGGGGLGDIVQGGNPDCHSSGLKKNTCNQPRTSLALYVYSRLKRSGNAEETKKVP